MFLAGYAVQNRDDANHVVGPYAVSISGDSKFVGRRMIAILWIGDNFVCFGRVSKYWVYLNIWVSREVCS